MSRFDTGDKVGAMVNGAYRVGKILSVNSNGTYCIVPRFFNESNDSFEINEIDIFGYCANVPSDNW